MIHKINRRKFIELFGCGCCSLVLPSCATVPITERKQLSLYPVATINRQASQAYEKFRFKTKLINKGNDIDKIKEIGKKLEYSIAKFFLDRDGNDPNINFEWDYILVKNDKMMNAWYMPGGIIAV